MSSKEVKADAGFRTFPKSFFSYVSSSMSLHIASTALRILFKDSLGWAGNNSITFKKWFFIKCTVKFFVMSENSVFQPHRCHHERHRPLRTSSWTENAVVGEVC